MAILVRRRLLARVEPWRKAVGPLARMQTADQAAGLRPLVAGSILPTSSGSTTRTAWWPPGASSRQLAENIRRVVDGKRGVAAAALRRAPRESSVELLRLRTLSDRELEAVAFALRHGMTAGADASRDRHSA